MRIVNFIYKLFFICYVVLLAQGCKGENMNIQIELSIEYPTEPIRFIDDTPIYPMGHNISLKTLFKNNSSSVISIDDPNTSQKYLLKMKSEGDIEDSFFMINPSKIDAMGEVTAPIPNTVDIIPEEMIAHSFKLYDIIPDKCFSPGYYNLYIEFDDMKSEVISFGVEFRPESISKLTDILLNEQADSWLRSESEEWLDLLPKKNEIIIGYSDETDEEKTKRIEANDKAAKLFLHQWHYDKDTDETKLFFEQFRLKNKTEGE